MDDDNVNILGLASDAQEAALKVLQDGIGKIPKEEDETLEVKRVLLITRYGTDHFGYTGGVHDDWSKMEDSELSQIAQTLALWQDEIVAEYQGRHMDTEDLPEADDPEIEDNK